MSTDFSNIKEAIKKGDRITAIKDLDALNFSNTNWKNQVISYSARYHEVLKKYNGNLIPFEKYNIEITKITNGILNLITEIESENIIAKKTLHIKLDEVTINNTIKIKKKSRNDFKKYGFLCIFIGVVVASLGFLPNNESSKILNFGGFIIILISTYPFHLMVIEKKDMDNLRQLINILALDYEEAFKIFNKICFKK
ncbi:hypothetical protein KO494_03135 [Lacinutrix sp. C3R15]|uniref:hypothetical protein n=1 Tax=Flavobacteriaceae TaxID=49546 RepID=UPI001C0828F0|nr:MULTISPECIES: hypothetical protein [Flavobacteriaceae]MBU2938525.1 hypothetical protein [Lacinutrix sp. C3R15]MDO6621839.1 hypothetical protein [Oceanihabitans sp. 1_MG-2023]